MPSAVRMRTDYSAQALRSLAKRSRDNNQSRRLLSLAAVLDGMRREDAARIGGIDRQTLRDWVRRFNKASPERLLADGFEADTPLFGREDKLDELLDPAQIVQVIDADASQKKVFEEVRRSASLVVQESRRARASRKPSPTCRPTVLT